MDVKALCLASAIDRGSNSIGNRGIGLDLFRDQSAGLGPRYRPNPSMVEVVEALSDFVGPGRIHVGIVRDRVEAIDQPSNQVAALLIRQTQRLFKDLGSGMRHEYPPRRESG